MDLRLNKVILRTARSDALIFRLNSLSIQEIRVEISFKHQRIIDVIETYKDIYVMTEKDVRVYGVGMERMGEADKNMVASGRKREWFKKMFLDETGVIKIVMSRDQEVCIKRVYERRVEQKCLFNVSSNIEKISKVGDSILIETGVLNYVIKQNDSVYSFQGAISQADDVFAVIGGVFRTFDIEKQIFVEGMAVMGSEAD